ncbi:hypothetical protein FUT69_04990 [Xylella taiwanensis]|uniref:Transposase n=1 Tax=Xylella taiwanensis TaxID=1444770 RepID=A0ABS8TSM3_9GAMM|nr:hypothetical protein [Xylella taiwanensis]MCD8455775.1 hypothetical protein [Xylella taiwanensis]MCD8458180.1 hypothetical protein [Xylella taiwanensis]MCD8460316.1 hypothetical protein [Xylella taiwanensis]MCD8463626.1 hypothetical protein [Xylella taiwanensis]MCD8464818.1 hypothetical protein [Xylella taiwanensis]
MQTKRGTPPAWRCFRNAVSGMPQCIPGPVRWCLWATAEDRGVPVIAARLCDKARMAGALQRRGSSG